MKKILEYLKKLKYLLPLIGAYLGSLGGQGVKEWRRVVLPIFFSIIGVICLESYWGILLGTFAIWTAIGYGIPEPIYDSGSDCTEIIDYVDEGSFLGRFFYNLFNHNHFLADIFTRGTVGLGMGLTGLVCPILKGNWLFYFIGLLFILIGQTVFSWKGLGEVNIFGKNLLRSDLWNYGFIFTGYMLMLL